MHVTLNSGQPVEITTLAERSDHPSGAPFDAGPWGEFMRHNRISDAFFWQSRHAFRELCLTATTEDGTVVAAAHAVRFAADSPGREELPEGGWEQVVVWAFMDGRQGVASTTACALDISVAVAVQGQGLAKQMVGALRQATADCGLSRLVAPVRPTWKDREPRTPMEPYARRVRADGLPYDPWLRTHVRAGGQIVGVAPTSWVVAASLSRWREWTGLPFDEDGPVDVPHALVPVQCDTQAGHAVYVEPNVWVRHAVGTLSPTARDPVGGTER
jgi:hypothetical protein